MMTNSTSVAYVLQIFPNKTETFVYREVMALREAGIDVITLANRMPNIEQLPEGMQALVESTLYIIPFNLLRLILANIWFLMTHFMGYFRAISVLFKETSHSPRIWLRNLMHFQGAVYLAYLIKDNEVKHLHAHFSNNPASLSMFMSILLDIPFSMTVHNNIFVDRLLLPAKLDHAKFIVCISEYTRDALVQYTSEPTQLLDKAYIIHCGIVIEDFRLTRDTADLHYPPIILSAAQLAERKGTRYLIEACAILKSRDIEFQCIIAGDGEQREMLESLVEQLSLQTNIRFVGAYSHTELCDMFKSSDLFVLPCVVTSQGDRDGIPVVLMEAMAAGLPVISTTVSGIPELVTSGRDGKLVSEQDSISLADAIQEVLENVDLRNQLKKSATEKIRQEFNLSKTIHQLIALIEGQPNGGSETRN